MSSSDPKLPTAAEKNRGRMQSNVARAESSIPASSGVPSKTSNTHWDEETTHNEKEDAPYNAWNEEEQTFAEASSQTFIPTNPDLPPAGIKVVSGTDAGKDFPLKRDTTRIGRSLSNDIVLTDISVSRKHVYIEFKNGTFFAIDKSSGNGTILNDELHEKPLPLFHQDNLVLGNTVVAFYCLTAMRSDATSPSAQSSSNNRSQAKVSIPPPLPKPTRPRVASVSTKALPANANSQSKAYDTSDALMDGARTDKSPSQECPDKNVPQQDSLPKSAPKEARTNNIAASGPSVRANEFSITKNSKLLRNIAIGVACITFLFMLIRIASGGDSQDVAKTEPTAKMKVTSKSIKSQPETNSTSPANVSDTSQEESKKAANQASAEEILLDPVPPAPIEPSANTPLEDTHNTEPTTPQPLNYSQALAEASLLYKDKQFSDAVKMLRGIQATTKQKKRANSLAYYYRKVGKAIASGEANAIRRPTVALTQFRTASATDRNFAGNKHRQYLRERLANVAVPAAQYYVRQGRYEQAKAAADTAQANGYRGTKLRSVRSSLSKKAKKLYNTAIKTRPSNREGANYLLKRVLKIVPKSDSLYKRASRLL